MADLNAIRTALANQLANKTGLRALAQAPDSITPPCAVVLPGNPLISYADDFSGSVSINLDVLLVISDAAPVDSTQRALDDLLTGPGSLPDALAADPSLSGVVQWAVPVSVTSYGRVQWAGVDYMGARLRVSVGAL